jgi:hypothetical protein
VSRRRGIVIGALLAVVIAGILVLSNTPADPYDRPPLHPRGTGPAGTRAMVELIESEGADARIGGEPVASDDVVLQLQDTWSGDPADDLERWVSDGGTLVVTDPRATLAAPRVGAIEGDTDERGACEVDALAPVGRIAPALPLLFEPSVGSSSCFARGSGDAPGGAAIDVRRLGAGLVVSVAGPDPFINTNLGARDNAVLATALLVPFDDVRVRVLDPTRFRSDDEVGDGTVLGALPPRGSQFIGQLVVAFLAFGLIRGRRLGRPVTEDLPVPLPASDLVLASGRLLDRNGDAWDAAERLRRRSRRDLGVALGLGADPDPFELANALCSRPGVDPEVVRAALLAPVTDAAALVATSTYLDRLRRDLHQ